MSKYRFSPDLKPEEYEDLRKAIQGKRLVGLKEGTPYVLEIREGKAGGNYDAFLFDGSRIGSFRRSFTKEELPVLSRVIWKMFGELKWEIQERQN